MSGEAITGSSVEGRAFAEASFSRVLDSEFHACTFIACDFSEVEIRKSRFVECHFGGSDLSLLKPFDSVFGESRFEDCRMLGVDWTLARWPKVALHEPNQFFRCEMSMSTFADLDIGSATFEECRLREVSFRSTRMSGARFGGSDFTGADLLGADLSRTDLTGVQNLWVDPRTTQMEGATVDATTAVTILEALGINLEDSGFN